MFKNRLWMVLLVLLTTAAMAISSFATDVVVEGPNLLKIIVPGIQGPPGPPGEPGPPGSIAFLNGTTVRFPVNSVFGRNGDVQPQAGDYTAAQVGADPAGTAVTTMSAHTTTYKHTNIPNDNQVAAMGGTYGTPSASNKYVTATDPSNTNARTPISHGSSHGANGSDPINISTSQVAGLTAALAGKQSTLSNATTLSKITENGSLPLWNGGVWPGGGGGGDMYKATYDPLGKAVDVYSRSNHTGTQSVSTITGLSSSAVIDTTTTANITDTTNKRFLTDAQRSVLINTSGTNSGDVTLGTTNGLSISGQQLSMGLSTNSTAGSLSASDHALFANGASLASTALQSESDPVVKAINGIVKSNGTTIQAAVAGTDYLTPSGNAAGLATQYIDWGAVSGGSSIKNKPTLPQSTTCNGTDKVSGYNATTGTYTCTTDQTGTAGTGISSLNGATVSTQTFANGTNVSVTTNTTTGVHTVGVAAAPTFTGTVTAPVFASNAADGSHDIFCSNSGDMDTSKDSMAAAMPNATAWGTADAGRYCFNKATGKFRYWTGSALADWTGTGGGGTWGTITGTLSAQTDLNTALSGKQAALGFTPLNPSSNLAELSNKSTAIANLGAAAAVGNQDIEITDSTKGLLLRSTGGNRYRLLVADNGTLSTALVNATVFAPNAPSGLSASGGNLQTTVNWSSSVVDASHSAATSYDVLWGTTSGGESNTLTGVTSPYTHTGLSTNTTYFYKVRANNTVGSATSTETSATTNSTTYTPNAPIGVTATAGDNQNTVAWTAGTVDGTHSAATSYNLLWGTTSGGESNTIAGVTSPYVHASLANGQAYYYKVRALNTAGQADSLEVNAAPLAPFLFEDTFSNSALDTTNFSSKTGGTGTVSETTSLALNSPSDSDIAYAWYRMPVSQTLQRKYTVAFNYASGSATPLGIGDVGNVRLVWSSDPSTLPANQSPDTRAFQISLGTNGTDASYFDASGAYTRSAKVTAGTVTTYKAVLTVQNSPNQVKWELQDASGAVLSTTGWLGWSAVRSGSGSLYLVMGDDISIAWQGQMNITDFKVESW